MNIKKTYFLTTVLIGTVWLVNGLLCKVINLVPRHEDIVARILGSDYSRLLIVLIGLSEIVMAVWIFSRYKSRLNAIIQIIIVSSMNILEYFLAQDLLLWGPFNALFALMFIGIVYYHEFILRNQIITAEK